MAGDPEVVPEVFLASQSLAEPPVQVVGKLEDLVHEEGEHVEKEEIKGEMILPVAVVVLCKCSSN